MSEYRVRIDTEARQIAIDRIDPKDGPVLYTSLSFDDARQMGLDKFARVLGENLVFDVPELRELFET